MSLVYEKILQEDLDLGHGSVTRTAPGGGTMTGNRINIGELISSYTEAERLLLTPYTKQLIFNTTSKKLNFYNGSAWMEINDGVL